MTAYGVYHTTTAAAERAKEMAAGRKAALREADERSAERRGEVRQVRALDGLGLLYKAGELTDDMHRAGLKYQTAWVSIQGVRGRNALDLSPPGDKDAAMQMVVDAGKLVDLIEAVATTRAELGVLRGVVGLGQSVRQFAGGGRAHRECQDRLIDLLGRIVKAGF
jgi:hypothetical protein